MLKVKTTVMESKIHGLGLFAAQRIDAQALVWRFERPDSKVALEDPRALKLLNRGYVNPRRRRAVVVCGDDAQYINFHGEEPANLHEWVMGDAFEAELVASRVIEPGEELTVWPSSDADYGRKMGIYT